MGLTHASLIDLKMSVDSVRVSNEKGSALRYGIIYHICVPCVVFCAAPCSVPRSAGCLAGGFTKGRGKDQYRIQLFVRKIKSSGDEPFSD